jgi:hypothetical protein
MVTELYSNKLLSMSADGTVVILTFGTKRTIFDSEGKSKELFHVTSRIAISPSTAAELLQGLNSLQGALSKKAA